LAALPARGAQTNKTKLIVWGLQSGKETAGLDAAVAEFERRNPTIDVSVLSMGAGAMNPQKLMTSIVGGVPPDVIHQDRFTIGDWASRDTFKPLDEFLQREANLPDGIRAENYYEAAGKRRPTKVACMPCRPALTRAC
jgi:multiple sugar transport system permease protein